MVNKLKTRILPAIVIAGLALPGYAEEFDNQYYLGLGLGVSQLEPKTNNTGYSVVDEQDFGGKIFVGMDFTKRWGVEVYYADLGAAALENNAINRSGDINYKLYGLSGLLHLYNSQGDEGLMNRRGWDVFAKAGIGGLDNSSDLPYKKQESSHYMLGLGTEYEWENGFALRLEGETFDKDVQFVSLGLLKRFGKDSPAPVAAPVVLPEPEPEPVIEVAPTPVVVKPVILDDDSDGVLNEVDRCPETVADQEVNEAGCDIFNAVIEGVQFETSSTVLTEESKTILDDVAEKLRASPDVKVAVMGHTDNQGLAKTNLDLSAKRAISVVRYLMSRGILNLRLQPEAYGESRPRTSNATAEGRYANRRVEFRQLK